MLVEMFKKYKLGGFGREFFWEYLNKRKQAYRDHLAKKQ